MKILLDSSFVLSCVRQGINFERLVDDFVDEEIEWIVPREVLDEIKKFKNKKISSVGLRVIESLKLRVVKLSGKNPNIDMKIVKYLEGKDIVLATMDGELKRKIENRVLVIRGLKRVEII